MQLILLVVALAALGFASIIAAIFSGRRVRLIEAHAESLNGGNVSSRTYFHHDIQKINGLYSEAVTRLLQPDEQEIETSNEGSFEGGVESSGFTAKIDRRRGVRRLAKYSLLTDWREKPAQIERKLQSRHEWQELNLSSGENGAQISNFLSAMTQAADAIGITIPSTLRQEFIDIWREKKGTFRIATIGSLPSFISVTADFTIFQESGDQPKRNLILESRHEAPDGPFSVRVVCTGGLNALDEDASVLQGLGGISATCMGQLVSSRGGEETRLTILAHYCYWSGRSSDD